MSTRIGAVRRLRLLLFVFLLLWCATTTTAEVTTTNNNNNNWYLYVTTANTTTMTSSSPAHHVQEYTRPPTTTNAVATADIMLTPDFLTSAYPHGRIVNFYAHWCPHCQHFRPQYIALSNALAALGPIPVDTFAISCVPFQKLCQHAHIHGYPTVRWYPPYSTNGTKLVHTDFVSATRIYAKFVPQATTTTTMMTNTTTTRSSSRTRQHITRPKKQHPNKEKTPKTPQHRTPYYTPPRTHDETFRDAHVSLDFAMHTAIYPTSEEAGPLDAVKQQVLQDFLRVLHRTVPRSASLQPVVRALLREFKTQVVQGPEQLTALMAQYPPPPPRSTPGLRPSHHHPQDTTTHVWSVASTQHGSGYTAGLWQLFHIMSVGLVVWNSNQDTRRVASGENKTPPGPPPEHVRIPPAEMADVLRNYIEQFFPCEVCQLHFLTTYDACALDRCTRLDTQTEHDTEIAALERYIQYPLWLFETHNNINIRLRKERIDLELEPEDLMTETDVVWPPVASCTKCWLSEGTRWDEMEIYKYLQYIYWPNADSSNKVSRQFEYRSSNSNEVSTSNVLDDITVDDFNTFHTRLAIFCTVCLALVFGYRKHRYNAKGIHKKNDENGVCPVTLSHKHNRLATKRIA